MVKTFHMEVNGDVKCKECGKGGAAKTNGMNEYGLCLSCATKKISSLKVTYDNIDQFTPKEIGLIMKNAQIFNNKDQPHCPTCNRERAVNNGDCLYCIEEKLKAGKNIKTKHLPDRWPASADIVMMAKEIMTKYHQTALEADIAFLMKLKHTLKNGAIVLGTCSKQSDKNKLLHGWDYIIEISWDMWAFFDDNQREALLFHELCHIRSEDDAWKIRPHNVEEFSAVIEIYGLWKPDLKDFAEAIRKAEEDEDTQIKIANM